MGVYVSPLLRCEGESEMMYRDAPYLPWQRQLCWLPVDLVRPRNSLCPSAAGEGSLDDLTEDVRRRGLQRPILVRRAEEGYVVASGNRRLLACRRAGMTHIDAVILPQLECLDGPQLLDALHSRCLHYLEEASVLCLLNSRHGYARETLARVTGEPVQAVTDRMRLNALGEEVRVCLLEEGLPERAALALLRLDDEALRLRVARKAARERLCIREVELLVAAAGRRAAAEKPRAPGHGRVISLVRDPRLYVNAIRRITEQMRSAGVAATITERRDGGCVEVTVRLPLRRRRAARWAGAAERQSI